MYNLDDSQQRYRTKAVMETLKMSLNLSHVLLSYVILTASFLRNDVFSYMINFATAYLHLEDSDFPFPHKPSVEQKTCHHTRIILINDISKIRRDK